MNTENRPRGVLVTGGGRGIGRAIAHRFARAGFAVAVNDVDAVAAETVAREVRDAGAEAIAVPADVADPRAAHTLVTQTVSRMGRLDALVNNAGIEHRASLDRHTATEWRRVLDVNLTAPFELARMAAPHLAAGGSGAIVNVCSVAVTGFSGQIAYDASKGGLLTLTRSLAVELGRRGSGPTRCAPDSSVPT
ncbi:SDR family NAD(P)-dependent oxidoreductase [Thermocatellispora tengchongensis]|uniref:SDR family NAD(P)-dependent oxidoreductase n=1 Tax=Thermocatellispora tengchongensis TaxID=1073253 RepID=UPI003634211F